MHRFLAVILLLCLGALAPLQGMSWRWCLLEHRVLASGPGVLGGEEQARSKCCTKCDPNLPVQHSSDCCVDMDHLPDSPLPASPERLPSAGCLLAVLPLMEWQTWLHPAVLEKRPVPPGLPDPIPIRGRQRQAVLSVWTV